MTPDELYAESFKRNYNIITEDEQQRLRQTKVALAGTGGVGGIYMATLARVGVGKFSIADPDTFDLSNINRQYGANIDTVGRSKVDVMKEVILSINPSAEVTITEGGLSPDNIEAFLEGCDIVLDCLDAFNLVELVKLHRTARQKKLYVLKAVPMAFGASMMVFSPHENDMSFSEYFKIEDSDDLDPEKMLGDINRIRTLYNNFMDGFSPSKLYSGYFPEDMFSPFNASGEFEFRPFPSFCPSVHLCADLVTTEVVLILLDKRKPVVVPQCLEIDLHDRVMQYTDS